MAITTLDGVIAGFKVPEEIFKLGGAVEGTGVLHSYFYTKGRPGAAAAPSPGLAGAALTTYAGQLPFTNPSGSEKCHIGKFEGVLSQAGTIFLLDRLWHNSGITVTTTTGQTINSVQWPARDMNGSTNGAGVLVGLEVFGAMGNGAITNTTMTYTNQAGTGSKTATIASFPASAAAGTFIPFELASGDTGVRSIQTLTLGTSYVSGTFHLVAFRVLARIGVLSFVSQQVDFVTGGAVELYDDTVPFVVIMPGATAGTTMWGQLIYTHG